MKDVNIFVFLSNLGVGLGCISLLSGQIFLGIALIGLGCVFRMSKK